jgi:hypothetical protein
LKVTQYVSLIRNGKVNQKVAKQRREAALKRRHIAAAKAAMKSVGRFGAQIRKAGLLREMMKKDVDSSPMSALKTGASGLADARSGDERGDDNVKGGDVPDVPRDAPVEVPEGEARAEGKGSLIEAWFQKEEEVLSKEELEGAARKSATTPSRESHVLADLDGEGDVLIHQERASAAGLATSEQPSVLIPAPAPASPGKRSQRAPSMLATPSSSPTAGDGVVEEQEEDVRYSPTMKIAEELRKQTADQAKEVLSKAERKAKQVNLSLLN